MAWTGTPSVIKTTSWIPASIASVAAPSAAAGGNEEDGDVGRVFDLRPVDAVVDRHPLHLLASLAGGHPGDDAGAGLLHIAGLHLPDAAGDSLHADATVGVDQDGHLLPLL